MRKKDRIEKLKKQRKYSRKYSPVKVLNYRLEQHHNRVKHTPKDNKGRKKAEDGLKLLRRKYPTIFY